MQRDGFETRQADAAVLRHDPNPLTARDAVSGREEASRTRTQHFCCVRVSALHDGREIDSRQRALQIAGQPIGTLLAFRSPDR